MSQYLTHKETLTHSIVVDIVRLICLVLSASVMSYDDNVQIM